MSLGAPTGDPLAIGADPFGGMTAFGFEVPQGDPGAIEAAARSAQALARSIAEQAQALRAAAGVALQSDGGWSGSAASAYADYTGHVTGVGAADGHACEQAATALMSLAQELAQAQSITRQAVADCGRYQDAMTRQQGAASAAGEAAQAADAGAASAVHPAAVDAFQKQATAARRQQQDAQNAADAAQAEMQAAQKRGQEACERYEQAARAASSRLLAAAGEMRAPSMPAGGAPVPVSVSPADVSLAAVMLRGAGSLSGAGEALTDPTRLSALGCGPVTPGTVVALLRDYDEERQLELIAASDKPLDGSLTGVIPGLSEIETQGEHFGTGVIDAAKGMANALQHPGQVLGSILATSPAYPEVVDGENPIQAQDLAQQQAEKLGGNAIDLSDWEHGRIAQGLGSLTASLAAGAGAGKLAGAVGESWAADPAATRAALTSNGLTYAGDLGVPHAGDLAGLGGEAAKLDRVQLAAAAKVAPAQVIAGVSDLSGLDALSAKVVRQLGQLPAEPRVIVVEPRPEPPPYRPPDVVRAARPRGFPRGR